MYEILKATAVVINKIDDKVKQLEEHLGSKGAKSYDEYCEMCGEIKGLLTARNFLTDLTKNMENSDE
jgi:uncharacterized protein YaaR (DUF327 family)